MQSIGASIGSHMSETTWWLAMSHVCLEHKEMVNSEQYMLQVDKAATLSKDASRRLSAAKAALASLQGTYIAMGGVAYGDVDGCMQAAYLDGFEVAVGWSQAHGIWFIGTFRPSLGLEDFEWSTEVDDRGQPKSGLISPQFAKASSMTEAATAAEIAKRHLST